MSEKDILNGDYTVNENGEIRVNYKDEIKVHLFNGYPTISYRGKTYYVHRLIAEAFIPNTNNYPCVNHKNGIKTDNRVENLEWCTYGENNAHAYRIGLKKPNTKTNKHKNICMLNDEKEIICVFTKMNNADKFFNKKLSPNIIRAIKLGQKCEGYYWDNYYPNDIKLKIR